MSVAKDLANYWFSFTVKLLIGPRKVFWLGISPLEKFPIPSQILNSKNIKLKREGGRVDFYLKVHIEDSRGVAASV